MSARTTQGALSVALILFAGCGYGQFQTARTTPSGQVRFTAAQLFVNNKNVEERGGVSVANFPQQFDFRVGLSEQVDLGAKLFLFSGVLADTKVNLIPNSSDFAFAAHAGLGAARVDMFAEEKPASVIHSPVGVITSYRFWGRLSPYLGLDYGFYWIFGRELESRDPKKVYAKRAGYGDGVGRITVGLEWEASKCLGLLVEYDLLIPLVDDPGDDFAFVINHIVGIGIRF
jgi:hypothetical protein